MQQGRPHETVRHRRKLYEHRLTLTRACNRRRKQTIRTIGYDWLHRLADNLREKHTRAQAMLQFNLDPFPVLIVHVLGSLNAPAATLSGTKGTQVTKRSSGRG